MKTDTYERLPVDQDQDVASHRAKRYQRDQWHRFFVVAALVAVVLFASPWTASLRPNALRRRHCHHSTKYAGEAISWENIGEIAGRKLEQSRLQVPMDQFDESNSAGKTFNLSLIRLRGKDGSQNLLLNPGGPGGSGFEFVYRRGEQLSEIVGEDYHLLSFDPRGVNGSTPAASCYPTAQAGEKLGGVRSTDAFRDSPETYAWTQNFVRACADTMDEHGAYINTPQTAADMNSILDAVGQKEMAYWGFSYGTTLGQTYASLFPERSHRVIIDGVSNNFWWYSNLLDTESFTDTEGVLEGFFDECIKAGKNCSLSAHAGSKKELHDVVFGLLDRLHDQPLSVYVNSTDYGLLTYDNVLYDGIFPALYKPANWYSLAENLAKLLDGNATAAWYAYGKNGGFNMQGEANQFVSMNDAPSGPAGGWKQDRQSLLERILPFANSSLFAPTEIGNIYQRQQWSIPRTHNFTQQKQVETAHPLLILSTTYDPICPLISAKSAFGAFQDSALVEVKGYGHCSVAVASTCLAKHVRAFLYNGTLPDGHVTCEVDGPYFIKPEEDGKIKAVAHFEDHEDERLHLAQLQLAREWEW